MLGGRAGVRTSRKPASATEPASATDIVSEGTDSREGDPEASEGCDWPQLCSLVAASERTKPRTIRCVAFASAPYKATRDGLASLVKSGRARRDLCDLSGDTVLQTDDAAVVRHERTECALRALILAKLSPPRNALAPLLPGNPQPSRRDPWNNRCIQLNGACGRLLPLDKNSDGGRKCILDDSRSSDRQLNEGGGVRGRRASDAGRAVPGWLEVDSYACMTNRSWFIGPWTVCSTRAWWWRRGRGHLHSQNHQHMARRRRPSSTWYCTTTAAASGSRSRMKKCATCKRRARPSSSARSRRRCRRMMI